MKNVKLLLFVIVTFSLLILSSCTKDDEIEKEKPIEKPGEPEKPKEPEKPNEKPDTKIDTIDFSKEYYQLLHFMPSKIPTSSTPIISTMDVLFQNPKISIRLKGYLSIPKEYTATYHPNVYNFYGTALASPIIVQYRDNEKVFSDTIPNPNYVWWQYLLNSNTSVMYLNFKGKHAYYKGNIYIGSLTLMTWTKAITYMNDGINFSSPDLKRTNAELSEQNRLVVNASEGTTHRYKYARLKISFNDSFEIIIKSNSIAEEANEDVLSIFKNHIDKNNVSINLLYNNTQLPTYQEGNFFKNIIKKEYSIDNEKLIIDFYYSTSKSTITIPLSEFTISNK